MTRTIVVVGDAFDGGLECYGPFADSAEAETWARAQFPDDTFVVTALHNPEEE